MSSFGYLSRLSIWGDFDVAEITKLLRLSPSSVIERAEMVDFAGDLRPSPMATWDLYAPEELGINEKLRFLFEVLCARAQAVAFITSRYKAALNLAPANGEILTLPPATMAKLGELGVTLECYCWERVEDDAN